MKESSPAPVFEAPPLSARESFLLELAEALHAAGAPAHRLEETLAEASGRLGLDAVVFSTPTMLMVAFGPPERQRPVMLRVTPADAHLGRLDRVHAVARRVMSGELDPGAGRVALADAFARTHRMSSLGVVLIWLALSAGAARFFGGGLPEMVTGGVIGALVGLLSLAWPRVTTGAPVLELLAAAVAAMVAGAVSTLLQPAGIHISAYVATLAGVVGLLPGMTLTVAVTELATRHLASGTARATAAATTLLQMAVGVALGSRIAAGLFGDTPALEPEPVPGWTLLAILPISATLLGLFTEALPRRLLAIVAVSVLGFFGARFGSELLGPELGAALGAFVVGLASRTHGRRAGCPQLVTLVPATLLLVPGSFGFRSVSLFLGADVTSGVDAALRMLLIAMAIAGGLLVAQAIGRPRTSI